MNSKLYVWVLFGIVAIIALGIAYSLKPEAISTIVPTPPPAPNPTSSSSLWPSSSIEATKRAPLPIRTDMMGGRLVMARDPVEAESRRVMPRDQEFFHETL